MTNSKLLLLSINLGLLYLVRTVAVFELNDNQADSAPGRLIKGASLEKSIGDADLSRIDEQGDAVTTGTVSNASSISPVQLVTFELFTPHNPDEAYVLRTGDEDNLRQSPFNKEWKTKVLIHGWMYMLTRNWIPEMRDTYLLSGDYNIIKVNWDSLSTDDYLVTTRMIRWVGESTGNLLEFLHEAADVPYCDFHLVGHSLGAHISGLAGARVPGLIGRVTGLDPARPLFEKPFLKKPDDRLDPTDAEFVDVIHTDAGCLAFRRPIGDVDFYPNGGTAPQPGCPKFKSMYCAHFRAVDFMRDSIIYPYEFVAVRCNSWKKYRSGECSRRRTAIMGEYASPQSRGKFYLETNAESPYGKAIN